ncbi:RNA polymerase sigma factor SigJ [Paenibacillus harenae]|uniref:RNA polymerase sigma factor SigJ n=1 Tax=Paenibacillus harenae TaxID=306543 RepID=UPI0003FDA12F|nr:RNA polymerase sigma factor SigJ [Paenibacillus harenae]
MDTERFYHSYRTMLFSLAYRMLGSVADAEDIVQEAFMIIDQLPADTHIVNEKAYLCKSVTNRCLNLLQSSAKQREVYVGIWLPEPLVRTGAANLDPSEIYQQKESLSTAYLLLLQQLSATERAVFLLREIFQYPYEDIADIVGKSVFNCRQIFLRAKKSIHHNPGKRSKGSVSGVTEPQVQQFIQALIDGDTNILLNLLATDAVHYTDGGGKARAVLTPVAGVDNVVQFYKEIMHWFKAAESRYSYLVTDVNGSAGVILSIDDRIAYVYSFDSANDRIRSIYATANPDKLKLVRRMLS